jgi:hypothetical protein
MKNFIRAQSAPWRNGVEFYIESEDKKRRVKQVIFETVEEFTPCEPSFMLSLDAAQTLIDDLWHAGLRPTEGTGSAGALRAVERHLEDMRTLVFKSHKKSAGTQPSNLRTQPSNLR